MWDYDFGSPLLYNFDDNTVRSILSEIGASLTRGFFHFHFWDFRLFEVPTESARRSEEGIAGFWSSLFGFKSLFVMV